MALAGVFAVLLRYLLLVLRDWSGGGDWVLVALLFFAPGPLFSIAVMIALPPAESPRAERAPEVLTLIAIVDDLALGVVWLGVMGLDRMRVSLNSLDRTLTYSALCIAAAFLGALLTCAVLLLSRISLGATSRWLVPRATAVSAMTSVPAMWLIQRNELGDSALLPLFVAEALSSIPFAVLAGRVLTFGIVRRGDTVLRPTEMKP
jgi:hypothetical protein